MAYYPYNGPEEYRPLSPWAYFGYGILYGIPVLGVIMLILHSISSANINRRNFARSYWCVYVILIVLCILLAAAGVSLSSLTGAVS